MKTKLDMTKRT